MSPPPLPTEKKKFGCLLRTTMFLISCYIGLIVICGVAFPRDPDAERKQQEKIKSEKDAEIQRVQLLTPDEKKNEIMTKVASDISFKAKDSFSSPVTKCEAYWIGDGRGWTVSARITIDDMSFISPQTLQHESLSFAKLCCQYGIDIESLNIIFDTTFNDGLGNKSIDKLLNVGLIQDIKKQINWGTIGDKKAIDQINFSRVFKTEYSHRSYSAEWNRSLKN